MSYIARNYADQKDLVGNGQCVTLVKEFSNAPAASLWSEGEKAVDLVKTGRIASGTVIATFVKGRYPNHAHGNHAAIFVKAIPGGIVVFDQWRTHKPVERIIRFGRPAGVGAAQRPELYSVVE
ncbi:hypothetical protein Jab_2c31190 [Janthinobacterium sp. HH01]|uniref:BPSL0067 family protein n=1 Tax=Janthinobacterium sp. HH01 TaxID=1198452 RepID=UPI0002AE8693|nr:BPSL0067 family protein [Janthinobacterium sp. HH01]ELX11017.1 hypothetical protein Jab_2c31190 [Janthinobacterium sp. HH01]